MNTITRIFGSTKPSNLEVDKELERRGLEMTDMTENIVNCDEQFHVFGHQSTRSDNPETAAKKFLIMLNELGQ